MWPVFASLRPAQIAARSSQMQQEGIEQLKHLVHLTEKLRRTMRFVPVSGIRQIEQPDLTLWSATFNFNEAVAEFGHPSEDWLTARDHSVLG
jgi:hypothetical protein